MSVKISPHEQFGDRGFILTDGDIRTEVTRTVHGDLLIRQTRPGQKMVSISTGSDSGISMYALLIKFLATQGYSRPRIRGEKNSLRDEALIDKMAKDEARWSGYKSFPYKLNNESIDGQSVAHLMPNGSLEIEAGAQRMVFSPAVVHALAENIPKIFPFKTAFRIIAAMIHRSVRETNPRELRPKRPAEYRARQKRIPPLRRRRPR